MLYDPANPSYPVKKTTELYLRSRRMAKTLRLPQLRNSATALLLWSALVGIAASLSVALFQAGVHYLRTFSFGIPYKADLSDSNNIPLRLIMLVPIAGGMLVGFASWLIRRFGTRDIVDAIEANALYGGRMSVRDSFNLASVTMISGAFGASVGMEAAYTQMGSSLGSRLGRYLNLRRDDVRTLVGCGAAGAIAAAFNAPLAGAFYAFELILGSYTPASLGAVAAAALLGTFTARALTGTAPIFVVPRAVHLQPVDYGLFVLVGLASAGLSILVMRGVTSTEALFRRNAIPVWLRPALGGVIIGSIALLYPSVLGSGHGAILSQLHSGFTVKMLVCLLLAKAAASAVSIGSGFRGGLFSAALFLGSILGSAIAECLAHTPLEIDVLAYTLVGMGSVGAGIVGAPVAMILLVLETTGDFSATVGVTVGVITASFAVRQWFGYSFATWRFHLRGIKIASAEDIGWVNDLPVGRLMEKDPPTILGSASLAQLAANFPPGSVKHVFAIDKAGTYLGMVDLAEALSPDMENPGAKSVSDFIHPEALFLLPRDNVKTALNRFLEAAVETLPVVTDESERHIVGALTEAYALRRYAQELERRRSAEPGNAGIFSPREE